MKHEHWCNQHDNTGNKDIRFNKHSWEITITIPADNEYDEGSRQAEISYCPYCGEHLPIPVELTEEQLIQKAYDKLNSEAIGIDEAATSLLHKLRKENFELTKANRDYEIRLSELTTATPGVRTEIDGIKKEINDLISRLEGAQE